jgi:hypothetical protein
VFLEGGHLGKSKGEVFETASAAARDWFVQWLKPSNIKLPVVDGIPQISVQELKRKRDAKEDVFVLDVRAPREHKIVNLGTSLIPVGDIERRAPSWQTRRTAKSSSTASWPAQPEGRACPEPGWIHEYFKPHRRNSGRVGKVGLATLPLSSRTSRWGQYGQSDTVVLTESAVSLPRLKTRRGERCFYKRQGF